jgi:hypothetical protein
MLAARLISIALAMANLGLSAQTGQSLLTVNVTDQSGVQSREPSLKFAYRSLEGLRKHGPTQQVMPYFISTREFTQSTWALWALKAGRAGLIYTETQTRRSEPN